MENEPQRNHAAVASDGRVPATQPPASPPASPPPALDANGFDPNDFDWRPVPRRARKDGWTPDVQTAFIEALARTGVVDHACREVNMSVSSAYTLRHAPGAEGFARAWIAVMARIADRVLDIAMQQAVMGEEIPVYDQDGVRTGVKWKYNTRMAQFLLRAYHPERFRFAHRDTRHPDEALPLPAPPMAEVIASLSPVTPADPHLLMPPATLAAAVKFADYEAAVRAPEPVDTSYRIDLAPPTHPRVHQRSRRNKERRACREEREDKRYGFDDDEDEKPVYEGPKPGDYEYRWPPDLSIWKGPTVAESIPPALAARPKRAPKPKPDLPTPKPTGGVDDRVQPATAPPPPIADDGDGPDDESV